MDRARPAERGNWPNSLGYPRSCSLSFVPLNNGHGGWGGVLLLPYFLNLSNRWGENYQPSLHVLASAHVVQEGSSAGGCDVGEPWRKRTRRYPPTNSTLVMIEYTGRGDGRRLLCGFTGSKPDDSAAAALQILPRERSRAGKLARVGYMAGLG
ncbi:hypothetical protein LZ31DRAFT_319946 [Colletotrichum somersetense]|nr:hypothetical protein LZ31DRAFT_319946 [Colletotrichum somersetense]